MNILSLTVIILWLLAALYFGTGGITKIENDNLLKKAFNQSDSIPTLYKGVAFRNKEALISFLEKDQVKKIYPWTDKIPSFLSYIITACSFSLLGCIIWIFVDVVLYKKRIDQVDYIHAPFLGLLTGLVVLGITYVIPTFFVSEDNDIKPTTLMFLSLFCGMYTDKFYSTLSNAFRHVIKTNQNIEK